MKILIRIHNTNDKEVPFRSIVELKGYTRHGLSKKQLFEWADDLAGSIIRRQLTRSDQQTAARVERLAPR